MNVVLDVSQFDETCTHFQKPVRNTVMDNSDFIRLVYSTGLFSLNGLLLRFTLKGARTERYFAKHKCVFPVRENRSVVDAIVAVEDAVLRRSGVANKVQVRKISEQLVGGAIKLFVVDKPGRAVNDFVLKVSGVWETESEYGVTFKFVGT